MTHDGGVFGDRLLILLEVRLEHVFLILHLLLDFLAEVLVLLVKALSYSLIFAHN